MGKDSRQAGIYHHAAPLVQEAFRLRSKLETMNDAGIFYGRDKRHVKET